MRIQNAGQDVCFKTIYEWDFLTEKLLKSPVIPEKDQVRNWQTITHGPNLALVPIFSSWVLKMIFTLFFKERIFCDVRNLYKIQISVFIKFYWNSHTHSCTYFAYGYIHTVMTELGSCDRDRMWLSHCFALVIRAL